MDKFDGFVCLHCQAHSYTLFGANFEHVDLYALYAHVLYGT